MEAVLIPGDLQRLKTRSYSGTEYRRGQFALFITRHDDGHAYVEFHRCSPQEFQNPCSEAEIQAVIDAFMGMELPEPNDA